MESQSEALHPLPEHIHHAFRVVLYLERDDEVVRISYQGRFPSKTRLDLAFEPLVERVMQIDVPKGRCSCLCSPTSTYTCWIGASGSARRRATSKVVSSGIVTTSCC